MQHDDLVYVEHMLDMVDQLAQLIAGKSKAQFDADLGLKMGVAHMIQIVGEAASQTSDLSRKSWPAIPWASLIGMRHRIVHDYFAIDYDIVWDVATIHVPALREPLRNILSRAK